MPVHGPRRLGAGDVTGCRTGRDRHRCRLFSSILGGILLGIGVLALVRSLFRQGVPVSPVRLKLLGFIIGPMMEEYLRRTLMIPGSDAWFFLQRPITTGLLAAAALSLAVVLLPSIRSRRELAFQE